MSPGCIGYRRVFHVPLECLNGGSHGRSWRSRQFDLDGNSPAAVSTTKSTFVPANVRQEFPESLVFFDIGGNEGSHPAVTGGAQCGPSTRIARRIVSKMKLPENLTLEVD